MPAIETDSGLCWIGCSNSGRRVVENFFDEDEAGEIISPAGNPRAAKFVRTKTLAGQAAGHRLRSARRDGLSGVISTSTSATPCTLGWRCSWRGLRHGAALGAATASAGAG